MSIRICAARQRSRGRCLDAVAVVGLGGALGALARYGLDGAFPVRGARFPWTTLGINVAGCLALGIVLAVVSERRQPSRLLRPFLAVGVLGGFTTFSTFAVEVVQRAERHPLVVVTYLVSSLVSGPIAVLAGDGVIRWMYARTRSRKNIGESP